MAITRCPYCHAIIDETDKYCNNCGTQLLFPEDEAVEEEIKGEKIVDADIEDRDYETGEVAEDRAGEEEKQEGEPLDAEEAPETEERAGEFTSEIPGQAEEGLGAGGDEEDVKGGGEAEAAGAERSKTEEVILVEEAEAAGKGTETAGTAVEGTSLTEPESRPAAAAKSEKTDGDEVRTGEMEEAEAEAEEAVPARAPVPLTFDTGELEGIGKTIELSREKLDRLLEAISEKPGKEGPFEEVSAATPEPKPDRKTGTLPPWVDGMKGAASFPPREETRDAGPRFLKTSGAGAEAAAGESGDAGTREAPLETEEEEIFPRRKPPDSGIGLPERVGQAALPFAPAAADEQEERSEAWEEPAAPEPARAPALGEEVAPPWSQARKDETAALEGEAEAGKSRPPFQFSLFLKAKAFDVLFVGIFWLVALWTAARSMEATLFELLSVTSRAVLFLYAIFLLIYFFLFKFFLGETLGDRLFKNRDEPAPER